MRVVAFYPGDYPNGFAPMSYRLHYYMKALKSKGAEVEIVIPSDFKKENGIFDSIPYSFVKTTKQSRYNSLKIASEYAAICGSLAKKSDVVFTTCTDNLYLTKIAGKVHREHGKIAVELNENPYSAFGSRLDTKLGLYLQRQYFLTRSLKNADGIIVISAALNDLIAEYKNKVAVVACIPILTGNKEITRNRLNKGAPFILHAGALSEFKDGVKAMLQAFAIAHKKLNGELMFVFTSKIAFPSLLKWIDDFIRQNHLEEYIIFKGLIPKEELNELYANCALAIVNKPSNAQNKYNFPSKLTELLPREIPIVASKTGELKDYFVDGENAFLVDANNVEQMAEKIVNIRTHPDEAAKIAHNGRLLAEKEFFYLNYADTLQKFFEQVVKI